MFSQLAVLLESPEPSIRFKVRSGVLGEDPASPEMRMLREEIRVSPRVQALLADRSGNGTLLRSRHPYQKWQGAHWVMASLADLGYPPGDRALTPIRDQLLDAWLAPEYYDEYDCSSRSTANTRRGVPVMQGRYRRCASQQGNALYAIATLGLANSRTAQLAERLMHWQWPDGGWNCDRNPAADSSSFMETLTPLRGLVAYARVADGPAVRESIRRAASVFLERKLFRRRADGTVIKPDFIALHYPLYWHYDVLGGLKVMAEAGLIQDDRCAEALDLLVSKRLPDGGFPAEKRYYRTSVRLTSGADHVGWGGVSKRRSNPWITADALTVLRAARRI